MCKLSSPKISGMGLLSVSSILLYTSIKEIFFWVDMKFLIRLFASSIFDFNRARLGLGFKEIKAMFSFGILLRIRENSFLKRSNTVLALTVSDAARSFSPQ